MKLGEEGIERERERERERESDRERQTDKQTKINIARTHGFCQPEAQLVW